MKTASELRIGNYIRHQGFITKVLGLLPDNQFVDYITEIKRDMDGAEGIPLTEEWLVKMGFFLKEHIATEKFYGCALFQDRNSDEFVIPYEGSYHYIRDISSSDYDGSTEYRTTTIQYVHQLQNLYFALTGEELKCA